MEDTPEDTGDERNDIENSNTETEPGIADNGMSRYAYDFGGRTIVLESAAADIPYLLDYDDRITDRYQNGVYLKGFDSYSDLRYDHWRDVERKLNCKIRVKFSGNWNTTPVQMQQEILAGTYAYSLCFPNALLASWSKLGLAVPLNEYVDFDSLEKLRNPLMRAMSSWGGKYYTINEALPTANLHAVQFNMEIRDREGLPDLVDVYNKGQWTWEKLTEIARLATRDFNGDGIIDLYGVSIPRLDWVANNFLQANGVPMVDFRNGKYVTNMDSPSFIRALTFISDLINVYKVQTNQTNYQNGKAYMFLGGQFDYHTYLFSQKGIKSRFVPTPLGPDNTEGKLVVSMKKYGWYIPSSEKDPKGIAYLLVNLMWTEGDPERPVLTYEQKKENLIKYWNVRFWPGSDADLGDLMDFWINKMTSDDLISTETVDIVGNGFVNLETTVASQLLNKLNTYTPVQQIIDSTKPMIDAILNEYN
ncbi:MAG TPA: hypothetical protein DD727_00005 [Clostridiales bacterium]|nr:hypothetical protein [Clostridiales bacterium]